MVCVAPYADLSLPAFHLAEGGVVTPIFVCLWLEQRGLQLLPDPPPPSSPWVSESAGRPHVHMPHDGVAFLECGWAGP